MIQIRIRTSASNLIAAYLFFVLGACSNIERYQRAYTDDENRAYAIALQRFLARHGNIYATSDVMKHREFYDVIFSIDKTPIDGTINRNTAEYRVDLHLGRTISEKEYCERLSARERPFWCANAMKGR
jgi:hypothetical protein